EYPSSRELALTALEEQLHAARDVGEALAARRTREERPNGTPVLLKPRECRLCFVVRHVERVSGVPLAQEDVLPDDRRRYHALEHERGRFARAPITRVVNDIEGSEDVAELAAEGACLLTPEIGQAGEVVGLALEPSPCLGIGKEHLAGLCHVPDAFSVADDDEQRGEIAHGGKGVRRAGAGASRPLRRDSAV